MNTEDNGVYFYLASPYSKYPGGHHEAWRAACKGAAELLKAGVNVYSPIAHTHPIAVEGGISPTNLDFWLPIDTALMKFARGIVVLKLVSWEKSQGIAKELEYFRAQHKQVFYMEPYVVPLQLVRAAKT